MKLSAILAPLIAAKVPHEIIMQTVQAWESEQADALEKRRKSDAERQARKREKDASHVTSRDVTVTASSREAGVARGLDNLQTKKISGKKEKEDSAAAPRSDLADFRSELSLILDPDRIESLVAVRRKKGATMTANTGRLLVAAIQRCHLPPAEVADEMALRNWTSVKPDWLESKSSPARNSTAPPRNDLDRMNAALDSLISGDPNGKPEPHSRTIDASFERRDWRGSEGVVQFPAVSARY